MVSPASAQPLLAEKLNGVWVWAASAREWSWLAVPNLFTTKDHFSHFAPWVPCIEGLPTSQRSDIWSRTVDSNVHLIAGLSFRLS